MRAGTWNLEWAARGPAERERQADVLAALRPDVWVLTEARADVLPQGWASASSEPIPLDRKDGGCFAVVGAPHLEPVDVPNLPTGAGGVVTTHGERWLVLGVCMPWRNNAPPLPPGAAPGAVDGPNQWLSVLASLDLALQRLSGLVAPGRVLLAGDLNQNLSGKPVGFKGGRDLLAGVLGRHGLLAYTAQEPSLLAQYGSVDHVCGPAVPAEVERWPDEAAGLSDHLGYVARIDLNCSVGRTG